MNGCSATQRGRSERPQPAGVDALLTEPGRRWVLLVVGIAILAIVLLASGLSGLELRPGQPLPRPGQESGELAGVFDMLPNSPILGAILLVLNVITLLLLPVAIIYFIVSPDGRRRIIRGLGLLLWILAFYFLMRANPEFFRELQIEPSALPEPGEFVVPDAEFTAAVPTWATPVMTFGLALLMAVGLVAAGWFIWRRSRLFADPLEQLAQEAQEALDALEAGANVKDTVMHCYFEMSRVLREQRGIQRAEAMTPREFEISLKDAGLPDREVEQLTRLFESVRYGARAPGEQEERQAITCLEAVVRACRGAS